MPSTQSPFSRSHAAGAAVGQRPPPLPEIAVAADEGSGGGCLSTGSLGDSSGVRRASLGPPLSDVSPGAADSMRRGSTDSDMASPKRSPTGWRRRSRQAASGLPDGPSSRSEASETDGKDVLGEGQHSRQQRQGLVQTLAARRAQQQQRQQQ